MVLKDGHTPWPRLARSWWVGGLAVVAVCLYSVALATRLHCGLGGCGGSLAARLLDPDAVGGLPRLFTAGLFLTVSVLAGSACRRATGRGRTWWAALALVAAGLTVAKLVSGHSMAKGSAPGITLLTSVVLAGVTLSGLWAAGRRWGVPATVPVVVALGIYVGAVLGLDLVTTLLSAVHDGPSARTVAASTFVEELGEALAALFVLVRVSRHAPRSVRGAQSVRQQ